MYCSWRKENWWYQGGSNQIHSETVSEPFSDGDIWPNASNTSTKLYWQNYQKYIKTNTIDTSYHIISYHISYHIHSLVSTPPPSQFSTAPAVPPGTALLARSTRRGARDARCKVGWRSPRPPSRSLRATPPWNSAGFFSTPPNDYIYNG